MFLHREAAALGQEKSQAKGVVVVQAGRAALAERVWWCLEQGVPSPVGELVAVSVVRAAPLPRAPERWSQRALLLEARSLFPRAWESLASEGWGSSMVWVLEMGLGSGCSGAS